MGFFDYVCYCTWLLLNLAHKVNSSAKTILILLAAAALWHLSKHDNIHPSEMKIGPVVVICAIVLSWMLQNRKTGSRPISDFNFSATTLLTSVLILGTGVSVVFSNNGHLSETAANMESLMQKVVEDNDAKFSWHQLQTEFSCCGINSFHDWTNIPVKYKQDFPDSCLCPAGAENCSKFGDFHLHATGCFSEVKRRWNLISIPLGWISILLGAGQIFQVALVNFMMELSWNIARSVLGTYLSIFGVNKTQTT